MAFLSSSNKNGNGFHVVLQILDDSLTFHLVAVNGRSYGELTNVSLKHHIIPTNGLSDVEVKKFLLTLNKGFTLLGEAASKKIGKNNKIKIKNASAIIFSPWFTLEKREGITIGKPGEVNYLSAKSIEEAVEAIDLSNLDKGHPIAAYVHEKSAIEVFVNSIKLNGYAISNPIGKKSKDIMISASFYTTSLAMLDSLKKDMYFHTKAPLKVMTFPKACALYVNVSSLKSPVLFVNVENETTSVCSVYNESSLVYNAQTIDIGLNNIIGSVMEKSGSDKEVAESYMRLTSEDLLSTNISLLVKSAQEEALSMWKSKVTDLISQIILSIGVSIDTKILTCRDSRFNAMFAKTLNKNDTYTDSFKEDIDIRKVIFESSLFNV